MKITRRKMLYIIDTNTTQVYKNSYAYSRISQMDGGKGKYWIDYYTFNTQVGYVSFQAAKQALVEFCENRIQDAKKNLRAAKRLRRAKVRL